MGGSIKCVWSLPQTKYSAARLSMENRAEQVGGGGGVNSLWGHQELSVAVVASVVHVCTNVLLCRWQPCWSRWSMGCSCCVSLTGVKDQLQVPVGRVDGHVTVM